MDRDDRDADLHALLAAGTPGARTRVLDGLLERYRDKVIRLAYAHLGSTDAAEDAAQEAFVRLWRALPRYDGRASLSTWLYGIARNTCLSELRKRRARLPSVPGVEADEDHGPADPQDMAGVSGAQLDAERLLAHLAPVPRQVMRLFYLEENSVEEVARMLDMPEGTVKAVLHRARKQLANVATDDFKETGT